MSLSGQAGRGVSAPEWPTVEEAGDDGKQLRWLVQPEESNGQLESREGDEEEQSHAAEGQRLTLARCEFHSS